MHASHPVRLIVGITGASGAIFGVRMLEALRGATLDGSALETHLIVSKWGAQTLAEETPYSLDRVRQMATCSYASGDQGAAVSSGSFLTSGMVVAPCSARTLAAIATGQGENLIHRAADVILKERRKLVLLVRETPLNEIHLENMLKLSRMGAVILPPVPAFYNHPASIEAMVDHVVMRTLDQFGIHTDLAGRWGSVNASS
jgi:4-hydroxy-3-polyprenylbenzoate decarboxylase